MAVHVGRRHVDAGVNLLVVAGQQLGWGVQELQGVVGNHVQGSSLSVRLNRSATAALASLRVE